MAMSREGGAPRGIGGSAPSRAPKKNKVLEKYKNTEGSTVTFTFGNKAGQSTSVKVKNSGNFTRDLLNAENKAINKGFNMGPGRTINIQKSADTPSNKQIKKINQKLGGVTRIGPLGNGR